MQFCARVFQNSDMKKHLSESNYKKSSERPRVFPGLMTPVQTTMFLHLDETG